MSTTAVPYTFKKKGFLLKWVLADILGPLIGLLCICGIAAILAPSLEIKWAGYAVVVGSILVTNILVGLGEHLVLKRHLKLNAGWFLASVIGSVFLALFWVVLMINPSIYPSEDPWVFLRLVILNDLLLFLITTFLQWRILRKLVKHAGNWFWMRALSFIGYLVFWPPAIFMSLFVGLGLNDSGEDPNLGIYLIICFVILIVVPQILSGATEGVISGAFMQLLLENPVVKVTSNPSSGEAVPGSQTEGETT